VTNFTIVINHLLVFFAERMLSKINKKELEEMAKRMRAAAKMLDESLKPKKVPKIVTETSTEQDEETASGLVFKRKRRATTPPVEHSRSDGHQDVIIVQECEDGSSKGKSLWDPTLDIPTYFEKAFLPNEDRERLMTFGEDHLVRDAMK